MLLYKRSLSIFILTWPCAAPYRGCILTFSLDSQSDRNTPLCVMLCHRDPPSWEPSEPSDLLSSNHGLGEKYNNHKKSKTLTWECWRLGCWHRCLDHVSRQLLSISPYPGRTGLGGGFPSLHGFKSDASDSPPQRIYLDILLIIYRKGHPVLFQLH
jgi:hypothetical protein